MTKKNFFQGLVLGVLFPVISVCIFAAVLGKGDIALGLGMLRASDQMANSIRIGILASCVVFTLAISKGRDKLAQGLVVSSLLALIYSLI